MYKLAIGYITTRNSKRLHMARSYFGVSQSFIFFHFPKTLFALPSFHMPSNNPVKDQREKGVNKKKEKKKEQNGSGNNNNKKTALSLPSLLLPPFLSRVFSVAKHHLSPKKRPL